MASVLTEAYFQDENAATDALEAILWADGAVCPHCGSTERIGRLEGVKDKKGRVRLGLWKCYDCRGQFTVRKGTIFEDSKVPLHLWFQAAYLMCASKKGVSSNQLHRTLGVTLKTAWFMSHRLREAMRETHIDPLGGEGRTVEFDETFVGGKEKNKHAVKRHSMGGGYGKEAVLSLVERGGKVRSHHIPTVTGDTLRPILRQQIHEASAVYTDDGGSRAGREFAGHQSVNHSIKGIRTRAGAHEHD
jgi:transposase-like protein